MAKMFYTIEEVADKLGVSTDRVKEMSEAGELYPFRDGNKLMFKSAQVDEVAANGGGGGDMEEDPLPMGDDLGGSDSAVLESAGTGLSSGIAGQDSLGGLSGLDLEDSGFGSVDGSGTGLGFDNPGGASDSGVIPLSGLGEQTAAASDTGAIPLSGIYEASDSGVIPLSGIAEQAETGISNKMEIDADDLGVDSADQEELDFLPTTPLAESGIAGHMDGSENDDVITGAFESSNEDNNASGGVEIELSDLGMDAESAEEELDFLPTTPFGNDDDDDIDGMGMLSGVGGFADDPSDASGMSVSDDSGGLLADDSGITDELGFSDDSGITDELGFSDDSGEIALSEDSGGISFGDDTGEMTIGDDSGELTIGDDSGELLAQDDSVTVTGDDLTVSDDSAAGSSGIGLVGEDDNLSLAGEDDMGDTLDLSGDSAAGATLDLAGESAAGATLDLSGESGAGGILDFGSDSGLDLAGDSGFDLSDDSGDGDALDLDEEAEPDRIPANRATATGISVFDADEVDMADPTGPTQLLDTDRESDELDLSGVGSGSGLLDLTKEGDDTSLGAELLDEIYPGGEGTEDVEVPSGAASIFDEVGGVESVPATFDTVEPVDDAEAGTLFDDDDDDDDDDFVPAGVGGGAIEVYQPGWDGWTGGVMIGATASLMILFVIMVNAINDVPLKLTMEFSKNLPGFAGGLAGGSIFLGIVGAVLGRMLGGGPAAAPAAGGGKKRKR